MPLLDHFHPPLSERRPWESFHATWCSTLADHLNQAVLPAGYLALEQVHSGAAIETRFDYWEVLHNELLHHHGPFGDLERFPAPQLKLDKEIPDIFEYLVLRSGRLIFYPTSERRAASKRSTFARRVMFPTLCTGRDQSPGDRRRFCSPPARAGASLRRGAPPHPPARLCG